MLQHTDQQSADNVNDHDEDPGDGIAANKLTCPVHRAVKIGFLSHFGAAFFRLIFTNQSGVKVGVNRHLLTRHTIENKARTHFCDTPGTFGNDHKVDDHENDKHHDTDSEIATNEEVTERFDHLSSRRRAGMPFHQNDTG